MIPKRVILHPSELAVEMERLFRFGIVGILATLVYVLVTLAVVASGLANPIVASVIGQTTSAFVSYFAHLHYSFGVPPQHRLFVWRFLVVAVITYLANIIVTYLLTKVFGISYLISIAAVMILIPILNYICNRLWVFMPGLAGPLEDRKP